MTPNKPIIYVVDDDSRILESLEALLSVAGYTVKLFSEAEAFLAAKKPDVPACLILDLNLGKSSGLDLQKQLTADAALPVIFLTGFGDIPTTVQAMKGGASEFLSKPVEEEQLLPAVETALKLAEEQWGERKRIQEIRSNYDTLTPRETEVLPFIVRGFLNKQTAYELGTSEITIRIHRGQIMRKMKADSLAHLVRLSARLGVPKA